MIGKILQGKYRIERKIGEGGFAIVYRATHLQLRKTVAIKVLKDHRFRKRFVREAVKMGQLDHASIVIVFDCGEHEGHVYIVMEYVDGLTLSELIQDTTLENSRISKIALQICLGMSYIHERGLIHQDLSLRNIMVRHPINGKQEVKIVDFGLAKITYEESATSAQGGGGTLHFLAPEVISGDKGDSRADIFSFGVCLYRMVNGYFPFEAEHPASIQYLIRTKFNLEFVDGTPVALKQVILRCLEKDPRARVQSFQELVPDFELLQRQLAQSHVPKLPPIGPVAGLANRGSKRNPYLNRKMIKHASEFFGRTSEIQRIYSRFDSPSPQCVSVVGERRIGKSSLLNFLYNKKHRQQYLHHHEDTIMVYLDCQGDSEFDVPQFVDLLFSMFMYEACGKCDYTMRDRTMGELDKVIRELDQQGHRVIVLMDEFEAITSNKRFDLGFFSKLRSLATNYNVAYVTSSCADLQLMCHTKDISDSPFFNIFTNQQLRLFSRDDALELVAVPSKREGVALEQHAEKILTLAGCFPMFLQIACSSVFEFLVSNRNASPDWDEIWKTYMNEAQPHYRFIWEHLDEASKENLKRIAAGKAITKKFVYVSEELERRGYLTGTKSGPDLFSKSFKGFVGRQFADGESGRRGLFDALRRKKGK